MNGEQQSDLRHTLRRQMAEKRVFSSNNGDKSETEELSVERLLQTKFASLMSRRLTPAGALFQNASSVQEEEETEKGREVLVSKDHPVGRSSKNDGDDVDGIMEFPPEQQRNKNSPKYIQHGASPTSKNTSGAASSSVETHDLLEEESVVDLLGTSMISLASDPNSSSASAGNSSSGSGASSNSNNSSPNKSASFSRAQQRSKNTSLHASPDNNAANLSSSGRNMQQQQQQQNENPNDDTSLQALSFYSIHITPEKAASPSQQQQQSKQQSKQHPTTPTTAVFDSTYINDNNHQNDDALEITTTAAASPFSTFRLNSTHIALDETQVYLSRIQELEEALASAKDGATQEAAKCVRWERRVHDLEQRLLKANSNVNNSDNHPSSLIRTGENSQASPSPLESMTSSSTPPSKAAPPPSTSSATKQVRFAHDSGQNQQHELETQNAAVLADLQQELENVRNESASFQSQLATALQTNQEAEIKRAALQERIQELEATNQMLQASDIEAANVSVQRQLQARLTEQGTLHAQEKQLFLDKLQAKNNEHASIRIEHRKNIHPSLSSGLEQATKNHNHNSSRQLEAAEIKLEEARREVDLWQTRLSEYKDASSETVGRLEQELSKAKKQVQELQQELLLQQTRSEEEKQRLVNSVEAAVSSIQHQYDVLDKQVSNATGSCQGRILQLSEFVAHLQASVVFEDEDDEEEVSSSSSSSSTSKLNVNAATGTRKLTPPNQDEEPVEWKVSSQGSLECQSAVASVDEIEVARGATSPSSSPVCTPPSKGAKSPGSFLNATIHENNKESPNLELMEEARDVAECEAKFASLFHDDVMTEAAFDSFEADAASSLAGLSHIFSPGSNAPDGLRSHDAQHPNDDLLQKSSAIETERDLLRQSCNEMAAEKGMLQSHQVEQQAKLEAIEKERDSLQTAVESLKLQLSECEESHQSLLKECERESHEQQSKLDKAELLASEMETERDALDSAVSSMQKQISGLERSRQDLVAKLSLARQERDQFIDSKKTLSDEKNAVEVDRTELREKLEHAETRASNMEAERDDLFSNVSTLKQRVAELEQSCKAIAQDSESEKGILEESIKTMSVEKDALGEKLADLTDVEAECSSLRRNLVESQDALEELKSAFIQCNEKLASSTLQANELVETVEAFKLTQEAAEELAHNAEERLLASQNELCDLHRERDELKSSIATLKEQLRAAEEESTALRSLSESQLNEKLLKLATSAKDAAECELSLCRKEVKATKLAIEAAQNDNTQSRQKSALALSVVRQDLARCQEELKASQLKVASIQEESREALDESSHSLALVREELARCHEELQVSQLEARAASQKIEQTHEESSFSLSVAQQELAGCRDALMHSEQEAKQLEEKCHRLRDYSRKLAGKCDQWESFYEHHTTIVARLKEANEFTRQRAAEMAHGYAEREEIYTGQLEQELLDIEKVLVDVAQALS